MKTLLVIFGITGDLSQRKLLPALRKVIEAEEAGEIAILGVSRRTADIRKLVGGELADISSLFTMDLAAAKDYAKLKKQIEKIPCDQTMVYLAVPPLAATQIANFLGKSGLNTENVKILFEKPFGIDEISAQAMIEETREYYDEHQLYRIDHYLAKSMAQNIVTFREKNPLLRSAWNKNDISRIEVIASEKIGVGQRGIVYEQMGALRDVVQGHLIQLLALTIMDISVSALDWRSIPRLRQEILATIKPADPSACYRGQYRGYQEEVENMGSKVETATVVKLYSDHPNWQGVPLILASGKAFGEKETAVRVYFKNQSGDPENCLTFRIQPNEGVSLDIITQHPGYARAYETKTLSFNYPKDIELPEAYEQVLVDAVESRRSLFTSSEEIIQSWRVLQPLLDAWAMDNMPLHTYEKGTDLKEIIGQV